MGCRELQCTAAHTHMNQHLERGQPGKLINLAGMKFGRLSILERAGRAKNGNALWKCACECGHETTADGHNLRNGTTQSCGCLQKQRTSAAKLQHGEAGKNGATGASAEYRAWTGIKTRCYNPNGDSYIYYGSRGIGMCDRWKSSYEAFLSDMGRRPSPKHSIERKNNDGDYTPDNCKWATIDEQAVNRRGNRWVTFNGITLTSSQWAKRLKCSPVTICRRLARWSVERALGTVIKRYA